MIYEFKFPDVGEGVHEGNILQIKVPVGEMVKAGDILAVVETDKVTAEIPSSKDGKVVRYGFEEGQVIEVGQTLAFIEIEGDAAADIPAPKSAPVEENANVVGELELGDGSVLPASGEGLTDASHENASLTDGSRSRKVLATPLARKLCMDLGIDISKIPGTGPAGRVTKGDIERFKNLVGSSSEKEVEVVSPKASSLSAAPAAPVRSSAGDTTVQLSKLRETIARNMLASSQIPTATVHEEILMDEIVRLRREINSHREESDRLSYLPIISKAVSIALKEFPSFNATFDAAKNEVTLHGAINLGIAMDNGQGLFVPVIKSCENLSMGEINREVKKYMDKVKKQTIAINEMRGGSFTISNYGSSGGLFANPLILPPQVAILGLGRIHQKPVVVNGEIKVGHVLPISLVIDHRVLDGAPAGRFLTRLRELLENPAHLMMAMV